MTIRTIAEDGAGTVRPVFDAFAGRGLAALGDGRVRSVGQHAGGPAAVTAFRAQRPGPGTPSLPAAGALP